MKIFSLIQNASSPTDGSPTIRMKWHSSRVLIPESPRIKVSASHLAICKNVKFQPYNQQSVKIYKHLAIYKNIKFQSHTQQSVKYKVSVSHLAICKNIKFQSHTQQICKNIKFQSHTQQSVKIYQVSVSQIAICKNIKFQSHTQQSVKIYSFSLTHCNL